MAEVSRRAHESPPTRVDTEETTRDADTAPRPVSTLLPPGTRVDRFEIIGQLGAGGMGIVYAAHDPKLERRVAIKLMHAEADGRRAAGRQARLLREAQALARLSHPNTTQVYDVGTHEDQVFVAMELVDGPNVAEWLAAARRGWAEILEVFLAAGQGLAAAHHAGFVHRDVKPENILVGRDGRVRVTDFGIVGRGASSESDGDSDERTPADDWAEENLTRTGARLGTPAYMAPEQHAGQTVDARADQFGFSVALYEALYGERPYAGSTPAELRRAVLAGTLAPAPRGSAVPGWIREVLLRGVARAPEDRWPTMNALLDALRRRRQSRWPVLAGGAGLIGGAVLLAGWLGDVGARAPGVCSGAASHLVGVWDDEVKAKLRRAFVQPDRPFTSEVFDRLVPVIDGYTEEWVKARTEACEATAVRREQSEAQMDLRMLCLDRRLVTVNGVVEAVSSPVAAVAERAVPLAFRLEPISGCADAEQLARAVPPPVPELRARVSGLRARIATAWALSLAGRTEEAITTARRVADEARTSSYVPVLGEALFVLGRAEGEGTDAEAAEAALTEASKVAAAARDDATLGATLSELVWVIGVKQHRHADALALRMPAELAIERSGGDALARGRLLHSVGTVLAMAARYDEAVRALEEAVIQKEKALGPDHAELAGTLSQLATRYLQRGEEARALPVYERAIAISERTLGADHPRVAGFRQQVGNLHYQAERFADAEANYRRAVEVFRARYGPEDARVALIETNLGNALDDLGRKEEAIALHAHALAVREKVYGPDHPEVAQSLLNYAVILDGERRAKEAIPMLERALAIREKSVGKEHPEYASVLVHIGEIHLGAGRFALAATALEQAMAIREAKLGAKHPLVGRTLLSLAEAYLGAGRRAEALRTADRVAALYADGKDAARLEKARALAAKARAGR